MKGLIRSDGARDWRGWVVGVAVTVSAIAHATDGSTRTESVSRATTSFEAGVALFAAERYEDSLTYFEASYELSPRPTALFNIAMCNKALVRNREAILHFEAFLESDSEDDGMRRDARAAIDELFRLVGILELAGAPDDASVTINEQYLGEMSAHDSLVLDPGRYHLVVAKEGFSPFQTTVTVVPETRSRVWAKLDPLEAPAPAIPRRAAPQHIELAEPLMSSAPPRNASPEAPGRKALRGAGVAMAPAGLAATVAGVAFSVRYRVNRKEGNRAARLYGETWNEDYVDQYNSAKKNMKKDKIGMAVGYGLGGLFLTTAIVMITIDRCRRVSAGTPDRRSVRIGYGAVSVRF